MKEKMICRGDLFYYDFGDNSGSVQSGERPVLVVQAGAIYRIDGTVLINRDIFDAYLERFHEPATGKGKEEMEDER